MLSNFDVKVKIQKRPPVLGKAQDQGGCRQRFGNPTPGLLGPDSQTQVEVRFNSEDGACGP